MTSARTGPVAPREDRRVDALTQRDSARQQLALSVDEFYHGTFLDYAGKGLSIPIGQPHAPM